MLSVGLPRPRLRLELATDSEYTRCRAAVMEFLYARHKLPSRAAGAAQAVAGERFTAPQPLDAGQRLLLKGGTIISLDPQVGNLVTGDVLIEGDLEAAA